MLHRATLSHSHQLGPARTDALPAYRGGSDAAVVLKAGAGAGTTSTSPTPAATTPAPAREPTLHEATIKAAALIRPGSSISISRCDSPRPHGLVTSVHVAAELVGGSVGLNGGKRAEHLQYNWLLHCRAPVT